MEKNCRRCAVLKPLTDFIYQRAATIRKPRKDSDGYSRTCKVCTKARRALPYIVYLVEALCSKCRTVKPRAEFWKDNGKARGLATHCKSCTKERIRQRKKDEGLRVGDNQVFAISQHERRLRAIEMYGGACECCGESNPGFLTFDHINNDGRKNRFNNAARIHSRGYDPTLRLLCYNCNCGRQFAGGSDKCCPHETERNQCLRLAG